MARKPAPKTDSTAEFVVMTNLEHDGVVYAPGSTVNLEPQDAVPLLQAGVVQLKAVE